MVRGVRLPGIACMELGVTNIVLYVGIGMVVVGSGWSAKNGHQRKFDFVV